MEDLRCALVGQEKKTNVATISSVNQRSAMKQFNTRLSRDESKTAVKLFHKNVILT